MCVTYRHPLDVGIGVGIEHVTLRVGTEQRLGLMLPCRSTSNAPISASTPIVVGDPFTPSARLPFPQHFALQDQPSLFQFDTKGGEGGKRWR